MQLTKRRKNSIFTFVIRLGGVAQLVERLNGIQEVRGSTPLISTTASFRGLCTAMPCRLRREPLRAGAAFMRVNSLTSLLRKRCLLRPPPHLHQRKSPMNTGLQAHRTSSFVTQNHPLTQALTQILFVPERLWILFCFWLSITRKGQSLSFCGRRVRLP